MVSLIFHTEKAATAELRIPKHVGLTYEHNGVFTRSSKRPANFQQTSGKRPAIHVYILNTFA